MPDRAHFMRDVEYVTSSRRDPVVLHDVKLAIEQTAPMLSSSMEYDIDTLDTSPPRYGRREVSVDVNALDREMWDSACEAFEADCTSGNPGTLYCDWWYARAYCVSHEVDEVHQSYVNGTLTFVLLDGYWTKSETFEFVRKEPGQDGVEHLDYPHDYPYDYAKPFDASHIENDQLTASAAQINVFGPVTNPSITIGGNVYRWEIEIPDGAYLACSFLRDRKSIELVGNGYSLDVFDCGVRGSGQDGGSYCFQPIPPGVSSVSWDGSFGFNVQIEKRKGGLPWTSS